MPEKKIRKGFSSTEIAISVALAAVAAVVAISLFNENISSMIASSGINKLFNNSDSKTGYSNFSQDYSKSQIEVQLMGEQGLTMLRRIANNKAIELINSDFSSNNPNGNSIAYLSLAIKALVGEPAVCVKMTKDSDAFCDKDGIGGYTYDVDLGSTTALTISKVNTAGTEVKETITVPIDSVVGNIIASYHIDLNSLGQSNLTEDQKYNLIADLSKKLISYLRPDVVLINPTAAFTNQLTTSIAKPKTLKDALIDLLNNLKGSVGDAYSGCSDSQDYWIPIKNFGVHIQYDQPWESRSCCNGTELHVGYGSSSTDVSHECWVDEGTKNKFNEWADNRISAISSSDKEGQDLVDLILKGPLTGTGKSYRNILRRDHVNSTTSCQKFKSGLENINKTFNQNIEIPECTPVGWRDDTAGD